MEPSTTAVTVISTLVPSLTTDVTTILTSYLESTVTKVSTVTITESGDEPTTYESLTTLTSTSTIYESTIETIASSDDTETEDTETYGTETGTETETEPQPTETVIVSPPYSEHDKEHWDIKVIEKWIYFFCPSRECTKWREWLTYVPKPWAGWLMGTIAMVTGIGLLIMTFLAGALEFLFGMLAMVLVAICSWLTAGLKNSNADVYVMYKASLWLNYFAAVLLLLVLFHLIFRLVVHLDNSLCVPARGLVFLSYFVALVEFVLLTAAIVLMFSGSISKVESGRHVLQAFMIIVLLMAVLALIAAFWAMSNDANGFHTAHGIIIIVSAVLLILWASYMVARAFIPLTGAGRYSQALWFTLNILPLILIGIILLLLNAPMLFTFKHCPMNACPVCNPNVAPYGHKHNHKYEHSHEGGYYNHHPPAQRQVPPRGPREMEDNVARFYV